MATPRRLAAAPEPDDEMVPADVDAATAAKEAPEIVEAFLEEGENGEPVDPERAPDDDDGIYYMTEDQARLRRIESALFVVREDQRMVRQIVTNGVLGIIALIILFGLSRRSVPAT